MRVLITADLHFSKDARDAYRFKAMRTIRDIIKARGVDLLVVLGDICESKNHHPSELVNDVVTEFHKFTKLCPVLITKGNHDYEVEDAPFWGFLRRIPGVTYVQTPTYATNLPLPPLHDLGRVLLLPHTPNYAKDWRHTDLGPYDIIFAHQTFAGALNEVGHRLDGVPLDIFSPWTLVISGDVHAPQQLGNVIYVGAPYTIDFGNDYIPRVLLMEKGGMQEIPVPGPQKRLVEGEDWHGQIQRLPKGSIVKVRIPFNPGGKFSWQELKDRAREFCERDGLQLEKVEPIIEKGKSRKVDARTPKSDTELLQAYAKSRSINDKVLKTGLWLLEKG